MYPSGKTQIKPTLLYKLTGIKEPVTKAFQKKFRETVSTKFRNDIQIAQIINKNRQYREKVHKNEIDIAKNLCYYNFTTKLTKT